MAHATSSTSSSTAPACSGSGGSDGGDGRACERHGVSRIAPAGREALPVACAAGPASAARAAAEFVAGERGDTVGGEIGYRVRFEQRGGRQTRLWFVTEGVFSRSLIRDPYLDEVGVVVLDEFHERHLQGDLALGVVRE